MTILSLLGIVKKRTCGALNSLVVNVLAVLALLEERLAHPLLFPPPWLQT